MSSGRKDSDAERPKPTDASKNQSPDRVLPGDMGESLTSSVQHQMQVFPRLALPEKQVESAIDAESDDLLQDLWYAIKLIIIPLLFAGTACLLVLPPIATGTAHFPPDTLWPIAIIIIIVALLQGIAIHYSRPLPGVWMLCTGGGLIVLLSISDFALFGPVAGIMLVIVLLILTGYVLRRSIEPVHEGVVDIVFAFGKYCRTLEPGFNLRFPWEKITQQVNVEETHWNCPPQKIQLSRDEDVILRALISYQVKPRAAHLAVTQVKNWEESLRDTFIATLQTIATVFTPDDFLNWPQSLDAYRQQSHHPVSSSPADDFGESAERRESINEYLCHYMRARAEHWGIQINWVNIRDVELVPHDLAMIDIDSIGQMSDEQLVLQEDAQLPVQTPQMAHVVVQTNGVPESKPNAVTALFEPAKPIQIPKEEILIKAYREVQNGKITDPESIRAIAATFEAVARDAQASAAVSFDAERATQNLHKQARSYEALQTVAKTTQP
jgi:regulator of protease activity HflC (stomatin/prohibitin superfamily)